MVKKKAPTQDASKKTIQKKKQQSIEDKTFGIKNKNKSKKVQAKIASIEKNVMNSGDPKMRKLEEERAKAKAERKAKTKALKVEQEALFGEALLAVSKKTNVNQKDGKIEAQGRDGNDDTAKKSTSRAMKMMYQMDAKEMEEKLREDPNYVPTLEDEIEMQRQEKVAELKKAGLGTPVTPESFAAWQEGKRKKRAAEARKKVEMELKKKKGGKGLSVLSGRDLYEYKKELFIDRDDDANEGEEEGGGGGNDNTSNNKNIGDADDDRGMDLKPAASDTKESGESVTTDSTSTNNGSLEHTNAQVAQVAAQVQSELFLEGDDDDLDDLEED